jgi:hypothetical protein
MYPVERSLVQKFAGRPFAIVGVNSDTNMERLKPVLKAEKITWRTFSGRSGRLSGIDFLAMGRPCVAVVFSD